MTGPCDMAVADRKLYTYGMGGTAAAKPRKTWMPEEVEKKTAGPTSRFDASRHKRRADSVVVAGKCESKGVIRAFVPRFGNAPLVGRSG